MSLKVWGGNTKKAKKNKIKRQSVKRCFCEVEVRTREAVIIYRPDDVKEVEPTDWIVLEVLRYHLQCALEYSSQYGRYLFCHPTLLFK